MTNSTVQPSQTTSHWLRHKVTVGVLLALIVLVGGAFRFMSVNWDDFASLHPDERFLTRNVLPLIGGRLEFTADNDNFPAQDVIVPAGATIQSRVNIPLDESLIVGGISGELSVDLARWWVGEERSRTFDNVEAASAAFANGEIDALIAGRTNSSMLISSGVSLRQLEPFASDDIQRVRCNAIYPETGGKGGYFDTFCSPLNPYNAGAGTYAYGTLPMFMAHWASNVVQTMEAQGLPIDFQGGTLVWRVLSAFFDVGTIIFIFLIGRKLHDSWAGLLAAVLYAAAPFAIQLSHFGTVNAITNFFVTLALWSAVHVQDRGRWFHYILFGIALGAALAGRINIIPLAGVVVLAGMVRCFPLLDDNVPAGERNRILAHNILGVFLAGLTTIIAFRIFNPNAFIGPSFFHMIPNPRFLSEASSSSFNVSGASDIPPNWQWVGRTSYLYPLKDMLLWGMGIAMGAMAWFGFVWSGYRIMRNKPLALRNITLFAWVLVYFGWIGNLWVMTMRYYLPIYGALAVFAGWALVELVRQARKRGQDLPLARLVLGAFGGFLLLLPIYYLSVGTALTTTAIVAGLVAVGLLATAVVPGIPRRSEVLVGFVVLFTLLWGTMFTNIYRQQATRVQASRWVWEQVPGDFAMEIDGAPRGTPLINIAVGNARPESSPDQESLFTSATRYNDEMPTMSQFVAPASGTIDSIVAPHLGDPDNDTGEESIYFSLAKIQDDSPPQLLWETTFSQNLSRDSHVLGDRYEIPIETPVQVEAGDRYQLKVEVVTGGPVIGGGSVVLTEGDWDDRLPTIMVCNLPDGVTLADNPSPGLVGYDECNGQQSWYGLVHSYDMAMSYSVDEPLKRDDIINGLEAGDYLTITSNRFYDSLSRNPMRWPMSNEYYDLLFDGELGYELVAVFDNHFELGPLSVDDQHLPIYDSPDWFNELESDEAFNVYDHPAVFIFKKAPDYDHARVELLLNSVPLNKISDIFAGMQEIGEQLAGVIYWSSLEANDAPTALMMPDDVERINETGGTWSDRFDSDSLLNTNQSVGVVVWWLVIIGFGWVVFPIVFAIFPQMGDRGYAVSKVAGLVLVGWIAWFGASLKLRLWSQGGVIVTLLLVAALSAALTYRHREALGTYIRDYWQRLLLIEVIAVLLFAFFIGVRLTNPDLWHHPMGGEKPMDFAYFNAVLRSTVFPPPNPWYSGSYINYYYVGYVIVGSPVLLLKIVPAFAYNLIVPTLFSVTGMGAFSVAFNIVDRWRVSNGETAREKYGARRMGNPWLAGIAALLLCVVLGNLDTIRVLGHGVAGLAGYERPQGLETYLIEQHENRNGLPPTSEERLEIRNRADANYLGDRLAYEIHNSAELAGSLISGTGRMLSGEPLPIYSNRWYWGPTRVYAETPGVGGNAITEMPYFTFVYGDLHAHMISMSVMLFIMLFVFNEVAVAANDNRSAFAIFLALALGGISVGLLKGINTWDWPTFLVLGIVGLGYAWWRRWETISRKSLVHLLVYVGGFIMIARLAIAPYDAWYASNYTSVNLWEGGKSPLWAYLDIHGVFIFLIVSLLIWDTSRWLRAESVRSLRGRGGWLLAGVGVTVLTLLGSVIAAALGYQVALVALPLILWIAILFFRRGQSVPMQYVLVLAGFALLLTFSVEVIVLSGDIGRQNTVFKFYIQAWLLFSVAGGAAFAWLLQSTDYWTNKLRVAWLAPLSVLVVIAAMFPVMATRARMYDRFSFETPVTLNGLDYMQYSNHYLLDYVAQISLDSDYHLIRWLQENVEGMPTIMEGRSAASEYKYNGRISINTGLPAVLGWRFHQQQQRTLPPLPQWVVQREENIWHFYTTGDIADAVGMLRHYDVSYVIVGEMEKSMTEPGRPTFPVLTTPEGIDKFSTMVEMGLLGVAYEHGEGRIYSVNHEALNQFALVNLAVSDALNLGNTAGVLPNTDFLQDETAATVRDILARYDTSFVALPTTDSLPVIASLREQDILRDYYTYAEGRIYQVNQNVINTEETN